MRRITLWLLSTVTILVLLFSYRTSTQAVAAHSPSTLPAKTAATEQKSAATPAAGGDDDETEESSAAPSVSPSAIPTTPAASAPSSSAAPSSSSATGTKTYTGESVSTRWGPVQVQITVTDGKIVSSEAIVYPMENHEDIEINSYAVPALNEEAVAAQSASIDMISGATVTSTGYITSLQSALDQAGL